MHSSISTKNSLITEQVAYMLIFVTLGLHEKTKYIIPDLLDFFFQNENGIVFSFVYSTKYAVILLCLIVEKSHTHACGSWETQVSSFHIFSA